MKLIKEDDKLYHFKGKDGEFKIVKKGLSKTAVDKISKIKEAQGASASQALACGGPVQKFKDGGEAEDFSQFDAPLTTDQDEDSDAINPGQPTVTPDRAPASADSSPVGEWIGKHLVSPVVEGVKGAGQGLGLLADDAKSVGKGVLKGAGYDLDAPDKEEAPQVGATSTPSAKDIQAQIDAATPKTKPSANGMPNYDAQLSGYMNDYSANANNIAKQRAASDAANAELADNYLKTGATYLQKSQDEQQKLQDENTELAKAVSNGHIDPNHYVNNMGVGSKIATGIGILFSGMGAGAHGTNTALSILQDKINKDIESQKDDLGNKKNLLSQNLSRLGNMQAATAATQAQRYAMLQGQIMKQAYQDGSQGALSQAKMATDMLQSKLIPLHQQLGQYNAQRQMMSDPNMPIMSKIAMVGGVGSPQGKALLSQYQQQVGAKTSLSDYDQAAKDATSLRYLGRNSPAQDAFKVDMMASLHKSTPALRGAALQHAAEAFLPTRMGGINGDNDLRRGHVFNAVNPNVPSFLAPNSSGGSGVPEEGDE